MTLTKPFTVESLGTAKDITSFITSVDSCKFQGTGKIRSASMMFDADGGAFISDSDFLGVGNTPIVNQFDAFEIIWTDENAVEKKMIMEVDTELGQKTGAGNLLPLEFKGREAALQRRKFTAFYQFKTPLFVITNIMEIYNSNRGTDEPTLASVGDVDGLETVPDNITNIYDFSKEISFYDALMQVIRRLNQPIGAGGVGNFYSLTFVDGEHQSTPQADTILINVFVQGAGTADNIQSTLSDPIHSLTYQIHSESGNQVLVRGQQGTGYVPTEFHEFISWVEEISNYPSYVAAQTYPTGITIRGSDNALYQANTDVPVSTPPPNVSFWDLATPDGAGGTVRLIPDINYSQWTKEKEVVTKNSCSNPTGTFNQGIFDDPAFFDGNLVIREGFNSADGSYNFWRDWAVIRETDESQVTVTGTQYLNFASFGLYNGFRVLVNGTGTNGFSGNDKFGRAFSNALVVYNGTEWIVLREFNGLTTTRVGDQVVLLSEGRTFEWNVPITARNDFANAHTHGSFNPKYRGTGSTFSWRDVSDTAGSNDVFHHPSNIERADGLFPKDINGDDYTSFVTDSAIKITYEYSLTSVLEDFWGRVGQAFDDTFTTLVDLFDSGDDGFDGVMEPTTAELDATEDAEYYNFGWWYVLPFPYPWSTFNGISEKVGALYGGAAGLNQKENFAVLDLQNANYSHSGNVGFNHTEVEDMGGPFTGIRFYFLFDIKLGGASKPYAGEIPFTVTAYDDLSQVWRADFIYRFLGDAQEITIGFDEFTVDRPSRTPWGLRTAFQNIVTPEIEIRSIFEPKRVRFITIQLNDSYDDSLRYLPITLNNVISTVYGLGTVTFEGTIDGLTLLKQPFTSSGIITDRIINPETVQMPNTRNLRQLRSVATAIQELHELQFEEYTVVKNLDCSLSVEQSINLIDPVMVKNSPRKLVVMSQDLTWNPTGPKAGAISTNTYTRRLNP